MNGQKIDSIIFDIGMVLVDFSWEAYLESFNFGEVTNKAIANAMFLGPYWGEFDRSLLSDDEILERFISGAPEYEAEIKNVFDTIGKTVGKRDYSVPWIQSLKDAGYKVYILSNFPEKTYHQALEAMPFLEFTDGGIFSYEVKKVKPEPEIFQALFDKYNISPGNAVFIDDAEINIKAAEQMGLNTILFKSKDQACEQLEQMLK